MLLGCQSMEKLRKYALAWLMVRDGWITTIQDALENRQRPADSTTKHWKALFTAFYATNINLDGQSTLAKQRGVMMWNAGLGSIPIIDQTAVKARHRGQYLEGSIEEAISLDVIREVIWDLHELNWRADFRLLDLQLRPQNQVDTLNFQIGDLSDMLALDHGWGFMTDYMAEPCPVTFTAEFEGKALWKDLARGIISVGQCMARWADPPMEEPLVNGKPAFSLADFRELQVLVANTYCRFYRHKMNRSPIVPAVWHEYGWIPSV